MDRPTATVIGLLLLCCLPACAIGQEFAKANPAKVEAAYLRNFAHYIGWPAESFADERSPWRICILGGDPFGEVLDDAFKGRSEQGRRFEVVRVNLRSELQLCQIVFVAQRGSDNRRAALAELANRPVLTVGDAPEFLQEGGIIRFVVADHVEFDINLDLARSASLKIQTKMLEVAHDVMENGTMRRRR